MRIGADRADQWLLTRDFNEMMDQTEKKGGAQRTEEDGYDFRLMLQACGLTEIQHLGYQFSWSGIRNEELVQCRLNCLVVNQHWRDMFPFAKAKYLEKVCSDHSHVLTLLENICGEDEKDLDMIRDG